MTSLGIVIAVSEYTGPMSKLPGCIKDGNAISTILNNVARFDEVLTINEDTRSGIVKAKLVDFLSRQKGRPIDDVVFYYTGHGDFVGGEFYYLLSDYESQRRKQTSLENTELDSLIRNLNPKLFVKIVDACHSGVSYIKNAEDFRDYITKGAKTQFSKLYFMFSSQSDQSSYQDSSLSFFTKQLLEAVKSHSGPLIRYKDLIDFISDAFEADAAQTPFFVTQADFTETFCETSSVLSVTVAGLLVPPKSSTTTTNNASRAALSITEFVKRDAELYCTEEEALSVLSRMSDKLGSMQMSDDLSTLYKPIVSEYKIHPPNSADIGEWIQANNAAKTYFVRTVSEMREVIKRIPKDPSQQLFRALGDDDFMSVARKIRQITGYNSTVQLPYTYAQVTAEPIYRNLNPAGCFIAPIISQTHLRLFWAFGFYSYVGWKDPRLNLPIKWATDEFALRDKEKLDAIIKTITVDFSSFVEAPIKAKWSPPTEAKLETKLGDADLTKTGDAA